MCVPIWDAAPPGSLLGDFQKLCRTFEDEIGGALGSADGEDLIGLPAKPLVGGEEGGELVREHRPELIDALDLSEEFALGKTGDHPIVAARLLVGLVLLRF